MSSAQLSLAGMSRTESQQCIAQIETAQTKKQAFSTALNAARRLRRGGAVRGRASQAEYARVAAACKHACAGAGSVPAWLLKFCKSHGIAVETPATVADVATDTWSDALDMLEKMQALNAVCDEAGINMPASEDKNANREEWDKLIAALQTRMDAIGADIQAKMVRLQDCMGQYDSYTK